jgi:hypothetical protein
MPVPIMIAPMINQWASVGIAFLRLIGAGRQGGEEKTAARATRWRRGTLARTRLSVRFGLMRLSFEADWRPRAHLEGYVETLKARLAAVEAVGGAGDCQGGEGRRPVRGARGRATSALLAVAHGLRLAFLQLSLPPRRLDYLTDFHTD